MRKPCLTNVPRVYFQKPVPGFVFEKNEGMYGSLKSINSAGQFQSYQLKISEIKTLKGEYIRRLLFDKNMKSEHRRSSQ